jgi:hypothetical protein
MSPSLLEIVQLPGKKETDMCGFTHKELSDDCTVLMTTHIIYVYKIS